MIGTQEAGPNWTEILGAATSAGTFLLVLVGARVAQQQLSETRRTRHTQLLNELGREWESLSKQRKFFVKKDPEELPTFFWQLGTDGREEAFWFIELTSFFERVALLAFEGGIPLELVEKYMGSTVIQTWEHWRLTIVYLRESKDAPTTCEHYERLYNDVKALRERANSA